MVASLLFSIPTSLLIWLIVNRELFYIGNGFLGAEYLLLIIVAFAALAFVVPSLFPAIMGRVWQILLAIAKWF